MPVRASRDIVGSAPVPDRMADSHIHRRPNPICNRSDGLDDDSHPTSFAARGVGGRQAGVARTRRAPRDEYALAQCVDPAPGAAHRNDESSAAGTGAAARPEGGEPTPAIDRDVDRNGRGILLCGRAVG